MSEPHSHIPYGDDGSGYYSDNTIGCYDVIGQTIPAVIKALESVPFSKGDGAFTICDYGTADGGTSIYLLSDCIAAIRKKYGADQEVLVVYEDQPVNDFKSVFMRVHGLIPGPTSYYEKYNNVFVTAAGTSFYSQCVPSNTVHLGFSSTATHWLSERPSHLDGIHHVVCKDEVQRKVFAEQAAKDWETILLHRAAELRKGSKLYIACFCVDNSGHYLGCSPHAKESMYQQMTECWEEMKNEGKICQEEHNAAQFNNYYRVEEEFRAPFKAGSPVYDAGLRLLSFETREVRCPYHLKWVNEGKKGDTDAAKKHAKWFTPNTRTWSNSTFLSALSDTRSTEEKAQLVDEFFQKYEDRVAAAPDDHSIDYYHAYLLVEKVSC